MVQGRDKIGGSACTEEVLASKRPTGVTKMGLWRGCFAQRDLAKMSAREVARSLHLLVSVDSWYGGYQKTEGHIH